MVLARLAERVDLRPAALAAARPRDKASSQREVAGMARNPTAELARHNTGASMFPSRERAVACARVGETFQN